MGKVFSRLFEPINIGKINLRNRIAMAPMGIVGLTNPDGSPTQRALDYYIERARGGAGLIITGVFKVENEIDVLPAKSARVTQAVVSPLGELCETVHSLGTKIFVQLTAGFGRVAGFHLLNGGQPVSASDIPYYWNPAIKCRPLSIEEIGKIVKAFGTAAKILAASGVDGIELHGHEGYLFDQFTTSIWNRRTDKYGGNLRNRLRFPIEVLEEIKNKAGNNYPVQYRFGLKHYIKGLNSGALSGEKYAEAGRDISESIEMAKLLEETGFDALHVDAGCYDSWYWAHPPIYQEHGCMIDMAAMVKQIAKIPIIAVGKLDIPEVAEQVISEGKADIIAIGRGLLADPFWPAKAQGGKVADIRPCIGCHDGCMGRFSTGKPLSCAVNPACGREKLFELHASDKHKKVLIIGGGVAGMEAARVAAIKGHQVTLCEKEKSIGGHLIEASVPEFKKDLRELLHWYQGQLKKLKVQVKLETEVSALLIEQENPDVTLVATGSSPVSSNLPCTEHPNVITCVDILLGKKVAGDTVAVIGGGLIGCEIALWLAQQNKKVTIVEMLPELMAGGLPVPHMNRIMLLDLLAVNNVTIITGVTVGEINNDGIVTTNSSSMKKAIVADTIVLSIGLKSNNTLYEMLQGKFEHVYALGDCREPRNIMGAIWDGYQVSQFI